MYLTSHRVRDLTGLLAGINALLHRHGDRPVPGVSWGEPDVVSIAERAPGTVVAERLEVPPAGTNRVSSFLDVVARDEMPPQTIERVLTAAEGEVEERGTPFHFMAEGVAVRFDLDAGLEGYEREEFRALKEQCLRLLGGRAVDDWKTREPLTIEVAISEDEARYALDSASMQRVRAKCTSGRPARSVIVQHDTGDAFERMHGDVIPHMILALTGLRLEDVIELGGVRVRDSATGKILREWPKRSSE